MDGRSELADLRARLDALTDEVAQGAALRRQLEAVRAQLRRAEESIERRDVILREARRRIEVLSREATQARAEALAARDALGAVTGSRWWLLRESFTRVARSGRRLVRRGRPGRRSAPAEPAQVEAWQPPTVTQSRPRVHRPIAGLRIAGIVGDDLVSGLERTCGLVTINPSDWEDELGNAQPHLLLVESDVHANDGSWQDAFDAEASALARLIDWCRAREIPTVFWNTRDPYEFDRWLTVASLFDHVATVDEQCVARYAGRGPFTSRNLMSVPAGITPRLFGPGSESRVQRACFILTPSHLTDARARQVTESLLLSVAPVGLDVFTQDGAELPFSLAPVARELTEPPAHLYARYAVALSGPAEGDAPRKLPRRVLEMLGAGAAVVAASTPDVSLELGPVVVSVDPGEAGAEVQALLEDGRRRSALGAESRAFVLREHTVAHRVGAIATGAGLAVDTRVARYAALVLADHRDHLDIALRVLAGLSIPPEEILVGTKAGATDLEGAGPTPAGTRFRIVEQNDAETSERFRRLARLGAAPWIVPVAGEPPEAGPLEQLVLRAPFAGADVLAFALDQSDANALSANVDLSVAVVRRSLVAERGWLGEPEEATRLIREGYRVLAVEKLHR